jgi:hypothetical protein
LTFFICYQEFSWFVFAITGPSIFVLLLILFDFFMVWLIINHFILSPLSIVMSKTVNTTLLTYQKMHGNVLSLKLVLNASYLIKHFVIISEFSRIITVYIEILIILQVYMNIEINEGKQYKQHILSTYCLSN